MLLSEFWLIPHLWSAIAPANLLPPVPYDDLGRTRLFPFKLRYLYAITMPIYKSIIEFKLAETFRNPKGHRHFMHFCEHPVMVIIDTLFPINSLSEFAEFLNAKDSRLHAYRVILRFLMTAAKVEYLLARVFSLCFHFMAVVIRMEHGIERSAGVFVPKECWILNENNIFQTHLPQKKKYLWNMHACIWNYLLIGTDKRNRFDLQMFQINKWRKVTSAK